MVELTKQQINRQDFVDNQIFELIQKLIPESSEVVWDIELIGEIRDAITEQMVAKKNMNKMQFYPYLKMRVESEVVK